VCGPHQIEVKSEIFRRRHAVSDRFREAVDGFVAALRMTGAVNPGEQLVVIFQPHAIGEEV